MRPERTAALIVVDVQNDFCPGGALAVPGGDEVAPIINDLMPRFGTVVLTQDWHPPDHGSFASNHLDRQPFEVVEMPYGPQVLWPDHCIQGSPGAAFHPALDTARAQLILRKGFRPEVDSYSAFFENDKTTRTGLSSYLAERGIRRVVLAGLALDFCVGFSALDARTCGFDPIVLEDACRAIDLAGSLSRTREAFQSAGVLVTSSRDLG